MSAVADTFCLSMKLPPPTDVAVLGFSGAKSIRVGYNTIRYIYMLLKADWRAALFSARHQKEQIRNY